jgi:uncharacterized protein (TIGR00369 family)
VILTPSDAQQILTDAFAQWVQDLNLTVASIDVSHCTLRMPLSDHLARHGGIVSGQALAALADTSAVLAAMGARGEFTPFATTDLHTQFLRPGTGTAILSHAEVIRAGRALTFVRVTQTSEDTGKPIATATVTLMAP